MKRFDFFQPIHNAIRGLLYETGALLQRTDFALPGQAETAVESLKAMIALLESYQAFCEQHTLPAVVAYEPAIADSLGQESAEAGSLREKLRALVNTFEVGLQESSRDWSAHDLIASFENLALFTIQYLRREENLACKILWRYYTNTELQSIAAIFTHQTVVATSPASAKSFGSNHPEPFELKGRERYLPNQKGFQSMAATAISALYPQNRSLLQDVLTAGVV